MKNFKYRWYWIKGYILYHSVFFIICLLILLILIIILLKYSQNCICNIIHSDNETFLSIPNAILTACLAGLFAWGRHMSDQKQSLIEKYNQKFCSDATIQAVNRYIMETYGGEVNEEISHPKPSDYEIEFYYRFFEELELSSERGLISRNVIYNFFAYYAFIGLKNNVLTGYELSKPISKSKESETELNISNNEQNESNDESGWTILSRFENIMRYNKNVRKLLDKKQ